MSPLPASAQLDSLIVTITSPTSGSTVGGTITVNASVTIIGSLTVSRVDFYVDGAFIGSDSTAPYAVSWNTRTVSNGSHTLTAVAQDILTIRWNSDPVTVTVSNPPTISSFTATSGPVGTSVTISGTNFTGATAVTFNGVSASFTVTSATSITATVPSGATTGPISVTMPGGTATSASTFTVSVGGGTTRIAGGGTTRIEETTTAVQYVGVWTQNYTGAPGGWSGGSIAFSVAVNAQATLTFNGTGVSWISYRGSNVGIANVYLDGTMVATVDGYAPTDTVQAVLYTSPPLASGSHTLAIEVTRTKNGASSDYLVVLDAFDVTGAPSDTTPPTVTITSPTTGATVSGTVTVSADASDDVGVAGVQFLVDGSPLGAEDTTLPYAVAWNTTTVPDGSHTLTAVARDIAGNTATSAPVTVTVSNAAPPPTSSATRFEETELSITYTSGTSAPGQPGDWFQGSRSRAWSSATAAFNRSAGARATFTFTGTSVSWIGFRASWAGIARVYVDGTFVTELDLYSTSEQVQTPVFTATDLTAGPHTLAVESTGRKNDAAVDYAVVVDAFDVSPASPLPATGTRFEETAASTTFTSGWTQGDTTKAWSGTAAVSATPSVPGARATFTFIGTKVSWIGLRGPQTGVARVYLDGAFQATVDTYSPTEMQAVVYTVTTPAAATHTLAIEVTGQKNPSATNSLIYLDAFDIRSRFEETDASITYTGAWTAQDTIRPYSGTSLQTGAATAARSATAGTSAQLVFTGTSVSWIGFRGPWVGIANVTLDGSFVALVDLYSATEQVQVPVFAATGLSAGGHTLKVDVTGERNAASTAAWVMIDAFDAVPVPALAITRVQETDPSIAFTSDWTAAGQSSLWSGENARQTVTAGGRATFTFTGTSVRWIGERGLATGLANVSIDGTFIAQVDTRAALQEEYQAALFGITGLASGTHTLTIDVIGRNNEPAGSTVERVVVDAFDVY